jgi:hypothetical protein
MIYVFSFFLLFIAEMLGILRDLFINGKNKLVGSILNGISAMMWCMKIIIVVDNPLTIISAGIGAFIGSFSAFYIHSKIEDYYLYKFKNTIKKYT